VTLLAWLIFRLRATDSSRPKFGLFFIVASQFANLVVGGFPVINTPTPLGLMNAFLTWLGLSLGGLEALLYVRVIKPKRNLNTTSILISLLAFNMINVFSMLFNNSPLLFSDFYQILSVLVLIALAPTVNDLEPTMHLIVLILVINIYCLFWNIKSPDQPFNSLLEYSFAPYKNIVWDWVGITTRYRGPFQHPNAAGAYFALFVIILLLSHRQYFKFWAVIAIFFIFLTSSRSSQIAVLLFITIRFSRRYFGREGPKFKWRFYFYVPLALLIYNLTFSLDWTASGRTTIWTNGLNNWIRNPIFGYGRVPDLFVENSFISTLVATGVLGGISFILVIVLMLRILIHNYSANAIYLSGVAAAFLFAINMEALFLGGYDIGALYVFFYFCVANDKSSYAHKLIPDHLHFASTTEIEFSKKLPQASFDSKSDTKTSHRGKISNKIAVK